MYGPFNWKAFTFLACYYMRFPSEQIHVINLVCSASLINHLYILAK